MPNHGGALARWGITTVEERFWAKVDKSGECWLWTACRHKREGYGTFRGPGSVTIAAHRFAYLTLVGPVPKGLVLDHLCRNRACVNPAHLEPVTDKTNNLRSPIAPSALNARKTHCDYGHPFDEANTYREPRGGRQCKACNAARTRAYKARLRGHH